MRTGVRISILILLAFGMAACAELEGPSPWPNERRILARGWVPRQVESKTPKVYCYRTLGTVDCHAKPVPADFNRRHDVTGSSSAKTPDAKPVAPDQAPAAAAKAPAVQPAKPEKPQDSADASE